MKKFFSILGLITLMIVSYSYSSFSVSVVMNHDDIMVYLNKIKDEYKVSSIDAKIDGNSIIPGKKGKEIDVEASYKKMKNINNFNSSLIVYKDIKPKISIEDNKDKYIEKGSGNRVSIILKVNDINDLSKIDKFIYDYTLDNKKTKVNNFCLYNNLEYLYSCSKKTYTIKPLIISKYPLKTTKEKVKSGSIIMYEVNDSFLKEYKIILKYIESRGLEIVSLKELISE